MTTIGGEVQFGELLRFSSPLDAAAAWEVGTAGDIETVIRDVKQEVEADDCHDDLSPWASDSATALENYPSIIMPLKREKRTVGDILRGVKVREDTLKCAVARLGGGARGLQVLMEHVSFWASESRDEDVTATIRRGIVDLGMPPAPKRHCNPEISANSDDGNGGDPCFDASPVGPCETVNHGAAYTRALRKSHMVRQRGQTRVRRQSSMSKYGNRSRQWRVSGSHEWSQDMEHKSSNENGKGYEFLFQKELRASDVSSLGRIVLPKKDAERHLPFLVVREGIMISLEDYHCGRFWTARYRFWPNNKSRMYLLENIGDFVNFHHLQEGDLLLCYRNEQGGYVIRGQKVPPNVNSPAEGLISKGAQVRENSPTRKMKSETTVMPVTHQFVDREGLADSSFDSLNCTSGEGDDAKYFQNGCSRQQDCFSRQSDYPTCSGDLLMSGFPASHTPLAHDCVFDPEVAMLSMDNVKNRFMDDDQFLE